MEPVKIKNPKSKHRLKVFKVNPDEDARIDERIEEFKRVTGFRSQGGEFSGFARWMLLYGEIPRPMSVRRMDALEAS